MTRPKTEKLYTSKGKPVVRPPMIYDYPDVERPRTRGDCANVPRPCPFVSCQWNLYLEVKRTGNLWLNFPDREPHEIEPECSCALDVADEGGAHIERVGELLNMTREGARLLEAQALGKCEGERRRVRRHVDEPLTDVPWGEAHERIAGVGR